MDVIKRVMNDLPDALKPQRLLSSSQLCFVGYLWYACKFSKAK